MISGVSSVSISSSASVNNSLPSCQLCHAFTEQSPVDISEGTFSVVRFYGRSNTSSTLAKRMERWLKQVGRSRIKRQAVQKSRMTAIAMIPLTTSLGIGTGRSIIRLVSPIVLTSLLVTLTLWIAATLTRLYKATLSRVMVVEQTILKLSQCHSPALVDKWEKMDDTPKQIDGE